MFQSSILKKSILRLKKVKFNIIEKFCDIDFFNIGSSGNTEDWGLKTRDTRDEPGSLMTQEDDPSSESFINVPHQIIRSSYYTCYSRCLDFASSCFNILRPK